MSPPQPQPPVASTPDPPVLAWLRGLLHAPEYRPTESEFADPIAFLSRVEREAAAYGICKVIPPYPYPSRRFVFAHLNCSLVTSSDGSNPTTSDASNPTSSPPASAAVFTTSQTHFVLKDMLDEEVGNNTLRNRELLLAAFGWQESWRRVQGNQSILSLSFHRMECRRESLSIEHLNVFPKKYSELRRDLIRIERHLLNEVGFICHVEHHHKFISNYLATLEAPELIQEAWNLANDRYII